MHAELSDEQLAVLQLNLISGVGPRLQSLLLARFQTARAVFNAPASEILAVERVGPKVSSAIVASRDFSEARREFQKCRETGTQLVFQDSDKYSRLLDTIHDPPSVLYVQGDLSERDNLAVAIVGSRACTHYGRTFAFKFAEQLAQAGVTVVSGLARGIDAAAHQGALAGGGRTLAICAPGLNQLYPPEHRELANQVRSQGALISESPMDRGPHKGLFPQRNRVIAGLSQGVIVIEASRTSGSLHTARHALEQGREVFALPSRIDSPASVGCHDLIRDGAILLRTVEDVLEALGPGVQPVKTASGQVVAVARELNLNEQERMILNLVEFSATSIDRILESANLEFSRVLSTLTILEMKKLVRRLPGGSIERIPS